MSDVARTPQATITIMKSNDGEINLDKTNVVEWENAWNFIMENICPLKPQEGFSVGFTFDGETYYIYFRCSDGYIIEVSKGNVKETVINRDIQYPPPYKGIINIEALRTALTKALPKNTANEKEIKATLQAQIKIISFFTAEAARFQKIRNDLKEYILKLYKSVEISTYAGLITNWGKELWVNSEITEDELRGDNPKIIIVENHIFYNGKEKLKLQAKYNTHKDYFEKYNKDYTFRTKKLRETEDKYKEIGDLQKINIKFYLLGGYKMIPDTVTDTPVPEPDPHATTATATINTSRPEKR